MSTQPPSGAVARRHDPSRKSFASDNWAGAHPEVLAALAAANGGHQPAYGADVYTERLHEVFREHFGPEAAAFPVFNGTGANVVALEALVPRWGAVIAADSAHINGDECGAPEKLAGIKILATPTQDGKLTPQLLDTHLHNFEGVHHARPSAVSITQSTELGTVYSPGEIAAVCDHAHRLGMLVHLDGSRLANAAASLDAPLRAITTDAGVDVVSFGGTKNGLLFGEAVVVLDPDIAHDFGYLRKMTGQLASKMRFVSAQFEALLAGDLWLRSARQANAMANRLADRVAGIDGVRVARPVQANAVFAVLPRAAAEALRQRHFFYDWDHSAGEVRWMCSFDTTEEDVDAFAADVEQEMRGLG